ncbi:MAG: DUF5677 domain-containing protein [Rhodobacterales bacterium]|jgi:hypothetical protein
MSIVVHSEDSEPSPFPKIERADVSPERIAAFSFERDYVGLGLDLMIEAGSYITIALNILGLDRAWTRDQAAIGGNMVRLYKLFSAMLEQTVNHRRETSFIFARLAFETIVTIRYPLQDYAPTLVDRYVQHSLDHERRLLAKIESNIAARGGIVLPIEDRMRRSIDRIFVSSGMQLQDLPKRKERDWGRKTLYEKAEAVGLGEAYLSMFAGASQNVHGAWGDLYAHHLATDGDGRFTPNIEWGAPRPQLLYSIAFLSLETAEDFAMFMGGEEVAKHLGPHLDDLRRRLRYADEAHEAYLARKTWPTI